MKMKRIILTLTMLVALVATASAQAEIKFDKLIHNFGSYEESSKPGTEGYLYLHQCGQQAFDYQPGYCQLRLYHTFLHQEAYRSRSEGTD